MNIAWALKWLWNFLLLQSWKRYRVNAICATGKSHFMHYCIIHHLYYPFLWFMRKKAYFAIKRASWSSYERRTGKKWNTWFWVINRCLHQFAVFPFSPRPHLSRKGREKKKKRLVSLDDCNSCINKQPSSRSSRLSTVQNWSNFYFRRQAPSILNPDELIHFLILDLYCLDDFMLD